MNSSLTTELNYNPIMANKREFKKYVDAIAADVCSEMMTVYYNVEGADRKAIAEAVEKVLVAAEKAKVNSNIFFDRGARAFGDMKEYSKAKADFFKSLFTKISSEFTAELDEAIKGFNNAVPEAVKKQNLESVSK